MKKKYRVYISNKKSDFKRASEFLNKEFGHLISSDIWTENIFEWKLSKRNPSGSGHLALAEVDGKIVGTAAIVKKRVLLDGKRFIGCEIGETYTHPDYRKNIKPINLFINISDPNDYVNKSIFGRLVSELKIELKKEKIDLIYGTPNQNSIKGYLKNLDFKKLKNYSNISMSKIELINYLKYKKLLKTAFLLNCIKFLINKIFYHLTRFLFKKKGFYYLQEAPSKINIEKLWQNNLNAKGFSLVRDYQYWKHRYLNHPNGNYKFFSIYSKYGLEALVTTRVEKIKNQETLYIVEWMTSDKVSFYFILRFLIKQHNEKGIIKYNLWTGKNTSDYFQAFFCGFIPTHNIPIIFLKSNSVSKIEKNKSIFKFFLGSSDTI